jgi:hypothetical protein
VAAVALWALGLAIVSDTYYRMIMYPCKHKSCVFWCSGKFQLHARGWLWEGMSGFLDSMTVSPEKALFCVTDLFF